MTSSWEQFEKLIKAEMRKVYSETAIDHAMNPRNVGDMDDADGFAKVTGPCGDTMEVWLKVKNSTITDAAFPRQIIGNVFLAMASCLKGVVRKVMGLQASAGMAVPWTMAARLRRVGTG